MPKNIHYITPTQQYNIDSIRVARLELDATAEEISVRMKKNPKYLGNIESPAHNATHTDQGMNQIATILSDIAKEKHSDLKANKISSKIKTKFSIHDFYPPKPLEDKLQIKTSIPIPKGAGPTVTLNAVIETEHFFDEARTLKEIVDHCNAFESMSWKESDFTATLDRADKKGKLKKFYDSNSKVYYVKPE